MVKKIFAYSYIYLILLLMYVPIIVLIIFSFSSDVYIGSFTEGFTFSLYGELFNLANEDARDIWVALGNTLIIAVISAAVATILGTLGAVGAYYSKRRTRAVLENINQVPVVNAEIVMALSLVVMFVFIGNVIFRGANLFSFWTLLAGHVVLSAPFVYLNVKPRLVQMDPALYEAALDLGCSPTTAIRKVMIPELIPGIISGFMVAITLSLDDFIITAFTRGSGLLSGAKNIETLSTLVQAKIKKGPIPTLLRPLTTLIFIGVIGAVVLVTIYRNKTAYVKKSTFRAKFREEA